VRKSFDEMVAAELLALLVLLVLLPVDVLANGFAVAPVSAWLAVDWLFRIDVIAAMFPPCIAVLPLFRFFAGR